MTTLHLAPISPNIPILSTPRKWFMTPTGDYYTVVPLTMERAQELVDNGVRRVIIPSNVRRDDSDEAEWILAKAGVHVCFRPTEEIRLTGS